MGRTRKKKDYIISAIVADGASRIRLVFNQKAWQKDRAFILAYKKLASHSLLIRSIEVLYSNKLSNELSIDLIKQNHVRKTKGFVWWK